MITKPDKSSNRPLDLHRVLNIMGTDNGTIPELNFVFAGVSVVAAGYAVLRRRSTGFSGSRHAYWSKVRKLDITFDFSDDPIAAFLSGDADPFHVVLTGLRSSTSEPIPDIGFFILEQDFVSINYKMGPQWTEGAVIGLFEIIQEIAALSTPVEITQSENDFDSDGSILLEAYRSWLNCRLSAPSGPT